LFDVCCELENIDRAQGFAVILRPWVGHILNTLGGDPCQNNMDQLECVQDQLDEVFPRQKVSAGGYVA